MRLSLRAVLLTLIALAILAGVGAYALWGEDWLSSCKPTTVNGVHFEHCEARLAPAHPPTPSRSREGDLGA